MITALPAPRPPISRTCRVTMTCLPPSPVTMPTNQPHLQLFYQSALHMTLTDPLPDCALHNARLSSGVFLPAWFWPWLFPTSLCCLLPGKPACLSPPITRLCVTSFRCRSCLSWTMSHTSFPVNLPAFTFLTTRLRALPSRSRFILFLVTSVNAHSREGVSRARIGL